MHLKTTLPLAIAAVIAASTAQANFSNFYEDASIGGKLRTVHIDAQRKGKSDRGAWTASAIVKAKSGYIFDMFGFDAAFYGIQKIDKRSDGDSKNLLDGNDNDFSKLGEAYLKGKFGDKDVNASFKLGRERIYTGLISGSGSRSIPSAWQGLDIDANFHGLNIGLAYVNAVLPRDKAALQQLETFDGERIDYIVGAEASYKFDNGLKLKYTNAFAKDYVQGHQFVTSKKYSFDSGDSVTVEGNYRVSQENGDLWTGDAPYARTRGGVTGGDNGFGDKAETFDFNVKYAFGAAYVRAGLGYTKADSYETTGTYKTARHYYDFGKSSYGAWNSWTNSGLIEEFYWDGEKVFALGAGYNFASIIPGLTLDYKFRKGSSIDLVDSASGEVTDSASESEHALDLKYKFQSVKGLSSRVRYAIYDQADVPGETDEKQLRVYLDYKF